MLFRLLDYGSQWLLFFQLLGVATGQLDQLFQVGGFVFAFGHSVLLLKHF